MTYWKRLSLLPINFFSFFNFFLWMKSVTEEVARRKTNFSLIRGHWVASCKASLSAPGICLSIGHPVPDELSLFLFQDHAEEVSRGQDTPSSP